MDEIPDIPGVEPSAVRQAFAALRPSDPMADLPWASRAEMRSEPLMRRLIDGTDDERRAHAIELVAMGSGAQRYLHAYLPIDMVKLVVARRVAWPVEDIETLLALVTAAAQTPVSGPPYAVDLVRPLLPSIERSCSAITTAQVDRIAPTVRGCAAVIPDAAVAARILALLGVPPGVRLDLLPLRDDFAPRARAVLEFSGEPEEALAAFVNLIASIPATGRPSGRWLSEAEVVRSRLEDPPRLVRVLLEALLFSEDTAMAVSEPWEGARVHTYLHHLDAANERNALGIVRFAGLTPDPALPRVLGLLALKCIGKLVGDESGRPALRSPRIAVAAVQVIGELGLPGGREALTALDEDVRHAGLRRQIAAAMAALD